MDFSIREREDIYLPVHSLLRTRRKRIEASSLHFCNDNITEENEVKNVKQKPDCGRCMKGMNKAMKGDKLL